MSDASAERDPIEILAAEFMERLRLGQRPSIEDYAARHPESVKEPMSNECRDSMNKAVALLKGLANTAPPNPDR